MLRCVIVVVGLIGMAGASGCAVFSHNSETSRAILYPHKDTETLAMTSEEHRQVVRSVAERDAKSLMDDLDLLFMTDRPSRLSRWHTR